jgi:hypothetical protein
MDDAPRNDATAPMIALLRQLGRRPVGLIAALTGHATAMLAPVVPFVLAPIAVAAADDGEAAQVTAAVLALVAMVALLGVLVLWRPLLDAGLVRAIDAELDEGAPLGLLSAVDRAWDDPARVIGARLLVDLLGQAASVLALPFLTVPARVARGAALGDAFADLLRDLGRRPAWHLGVWVLFALVLLPILVWPPLVTSLPVAYAAHADRCVRDAAERPVAAGSASRDLLWALLAVLVLANVFDTLTGIPFGLAGLAGAAKGEAVSAAIALAVAVRALVGWGVLAPVALAVRSGDPHAARRAAAVVLAVSVLMTLIGLAMGCCFGWLLVGVLALPVLLVSVDAPETPG